MSKNFQDWLDELKSRIDIVNVISKYLALEQKGRNMWGLCPFHHEKTPSFSINPDGQFYHCFGCGVSGDVIKFVQEIEGMDFIDTIKMLAGQVGMTIPESNISGDSAKQKEKKDILLQLIRDAANYYHLNLRSDKAKIANQYNIKRGITPEIIRKFGIGYSLGFKEIIEYLKSKGYTEQLMIESGVVENKNNTYYDSLAGRLIFPILDQHGQPIGFGGRLLEEKDFAKYKNTRETSLFVKNRILYGLNLVKSAKIKEKIDSIIIVEGYMDVIALNSAGYNNVVASMGTALTKEQAKLLKRQVQKVYIAYDGDSAGQKATIRGLDILFNEGLDVYVSTLPESKDPDDVIKENGKDGFESILSKALPLVEYKLKILEKYYDLDTLEGKGKYAYNAIRVLKSLKSDIEMEVYLDGISELTNTSIDALKAEFSQNYTEQKISSHSSNQPISKGTAYTIAENYILYALLYGKEYADYKDEDLESLISSDITKKIYDYVMKCIQEDRQPIAGTLLTMFKEEDKPRVMDIIDFEEMPEEEKSIRYYNDCIKLLKRKKYESLIKQCAIDYDNVKDMDEKRIIMEKLQKLRHKMSLLKEEN